MTPPPGYVLIRPETLVALQKAVEAALGARAADCLVAGGLAGGAKATASLDIPKDERVRRLLEAGREIGWGDFALERLTPTELIVSVGDSPFARVYGRAGAPVCHLTRGVLQALASTVLEAPVAVEETACAAVGAERCRFETRADGRADAALLRGVLHIGIVVDDLEQSLREWQRVFGVSVGDRWQSDVGVKVAFLDVAGTRLELVEYTGPIVERFGPVLARREGVHHVCFAVDDLDAALGAVRARGLRVVPGFPLEGAHGRIAFLEPEPTTGLVTELCQPRGPA